MEIWSLFNKTTIKSEYIEEKQCSHGAVVVIYSSLETLVSVNTSVVGGSITLGL